MGFIQDPLRIMVPLWFNGCVIGGLDIRVEQRWNSRGRVLAT